MKRRILIAHLESHGCQAIREANHGTFYENFVTGQRAPVPRHREISDNLAKVICRELSVPPVDE